MTCLYNYPYNQTNGDYMQTDMNRTQNNMGYMQPEMNRTQNNTGYMPGRVQQTNPMPAQTQNRMPQMSSMPAQTQNRMPQTSPMPAQAQNRMPQMSPMPAQMQMSPMPAQMQTSPRNMQTAAPTGTTPLARSLPAMPTGPSTAPQLPLTSLAGTVPSYTPSITPLAGSMPTTTMGPETPVTVASPYYTAGFLKNFIGKNVRVEFLLGTSGSISDRVGTLLEVGASYIVIQPLLTDDLLMCDLYSIRFVTIFG